MDEDTNQTKETDQHGHCIYMHEIASDREKYQKRLEKFFDSIVLEGKTVEDKSKSFAKKIKEDEDTMDI